ncbi:hypothetical protein QQ045_012885 [Rhodiola kirilowii]
MDIMHFVQCVSIFTFSLLLVHSIEARDTRISNGCGFFATPTFNIYIRNGMGQDTPMTVHCKSKDDDLGSHVVPFGGVYKIPPFNENIVTGVTLFWCDVYWKNRHEVFDAFNDRDTAWFNSCVGQSCTCQWILTPDETCYRKENSKIYDQCYRWRGRH